MEHTIEGCPRRLNQEGITVIFVWIDSFDLSSADIKVLEINISSNLIALLDDDLSF